MLFQEDGDVLIMAGNFQTEFLDGVPQREMWQDLCDGPMFVGMQDWEKRGMRDEVQLHRSCQGTGKHLRYNCTLRSAPAAAVTLSAAAASGSLPVVAGSDRPLQQMSFAGLKKRTVEATQETTGMQVAEDCGCFAELLESDGAAI
eukprot:s847_g28.t1